MKGLQLTDPVFEKKERLNSLDRFAMRFIRDERDLPFIHLCLKLQFLVIPVAIYLFFNFSWWIAVPYVVILLAVFTGPFILMLHNTSHRPFFKQEYDFMNSYIPWVLGPFCGETPETYFCHHIGMHHVENNLPPDLSTTLSGPRDKVANFWRYFYQFFFFGVKDLAYYFRQKNKMQFVKRLLMGELSFIVVAIALSFVNWQATLVVFIIPFVLVRFLMMAGNWAQHSFVDIEDPNNSYKNSITCINSAYNRQCFNDGYHIGHHVRPNLHWTDMPGDFLKNMDKYAENNSVVFQGVDYNYIWFMLMTKNYGKLADKFVNVGDRFADKQEIMDFLKSRVHASIPTTDPTYHPRLRTTH